MYICTVYKKYFFNIYIYTNNIFVNHYIVDILTKAFKEFSKIGAITYMELQIEVYIFL